MVIVPQKKTAQFIKIAENYKQGIEQINSLSAQTAECEL